MVFAFDFDGTVTRVETLPLLARELGLFREMSELTERTLRGEIDFRASLKMRYEILREIPLARIQEIMASVPLDPYIEGFIQGHRESCAIVTGNLLEWIEPVRARLGCEFYASRLEGGRLQVLEKGAVIERLKERGPVAAIGEGFNDVPMLGAADVAVAFGGVHEPVREALVAADFVVRSGEELCELLERLAGRGGTELLR